MSPQDILRLRLRQQQLSSTRFSDPASVAGWMGAMQAQDYAQSRWALGVRLPASSDAAISAAIDAGQVIRTHILRPTWHLVAATDIRWMLDLSGPRVTALNALMGKKVGLTPEVYKKSHAVIEKTLQGGRHCTRTELVAELEKAGIQADAYQATHLMMQAELDGIICNGAMRGKQFTYALLEEQAPNAPRLPRPEALAMLVRRYFQSHGPATLQDFVWWSGLTVSDAKAGMEAVKRDFTEISIDNQTYWMSTDAAAADHSQTEVHLLPAFDEYMVAYKNRDAALDSDQKNRAITSNGIFKPIVVINGKVVGTWQRTLKKDKVWVEVSLLSAVRAAEKEAIAEKVSIFGRYLGLPATVLYPT